jgi:hypothetical protein
MRGRPLIHGYSATTESGRGQYGPPLPPPPVDVAVYVDTLWGLGWLAPACDGVRLVLAMHVVGHDQD